jgi:hypothetical protein
MHRANVRKWTPFKAYKRKKHKNNISRNAIFLKFSFDIHVQGISRLNPQRWDKNGRPYIYPLIISQFCQLNPPSTGSKNLILCENSRFNGTTFYYNFCWAKQHVFKSVCQKVCQFTLNNFTSLSCIVIKRDFFVFR